MLPIIKAIRHRTLGKDLILVLTLSVCFTIAILTAGYYFFSIKAAYRQLLTRAETDSDELTQILSLPAWNYDLELVRTIASVYLKTESIDAIRIRIDTDIIFDNFSDKTTLPLRTERDIFYKERRLGSVELGFSDKAIRQTYTRLLVLVIAIFFVVSGAIFTTTRLVLKRFLYPFIQQLLAGIRSISAGRYRISLPPVPQTDINEIIQGVNLMGDQIEKRTAAVYKSEMKYRNIFNNAMEGIFQTTPGGKIISANPRLVSILGYDSQEELINGIADTGKTVYVDQDERDHFIRSVEHLGTVEKFKCRLFRKDKSIMWASVNARAVYDSDGKMIHVEGLMEDISSIQKEKEERKKAEAALVKWGHVFQYAGWGIAILSPDCTRIEMVNPACAAMHGYKVNELRNTPVMNLFSPVYNHMIPIWFQTAKYKGRDTVEVNNIRKDGSIFPVQIDISAAKDNDGRYLYVILNIQDITEKKKARQEKKKVTEQLYQAQKMEAIGTLAGGIAHDFNNILTAIIGYTDISLASDTKDQEVHHNLQQILKAGTRASELVNQILAFCRQETRSLEPIQFHLIVKEAINLLRATIPTTIEIRQQIDPTCGMINADPSQTHQVLMNLCTNAYHAMRTEGGRLTIGLIPLEFTHKNHMNVPGGRYLKLTVSDTGHGMDALTMERIFEPYYTTKKQERGTGLGLAVVHGIVKNHGGHITVDSHPGKGTTFHVYFPEMSPGESHPEHIDTEEEVSGGNERILFVDDENPIVLVGKTILERLGYQVTTITRSDKALELFSDNPDLFDLVITDMTMPRMTGVQLGQALLALRPDIRLIICTGYNDSIDKDKALASGFKAYMQKPINEKDFALTVRKVLDDKQP